MSELPPRLTLLQAVAWIATRNAGVVWRADPKRGHTALLNAPDEFVEACFPSGAGYPLISLDLWNGLHPTDHAMSADEACEALLEKLREGELRAYEKGEEDRPKSKAFWDDITLEENGRELSVPGGTQVKIVREDLLRLWPLSASAQVSPSPDQTMAEISSTPEPGVEPDAVRATGGVERALSRETPVRSGAPGRPTSMHLIEAEFARRVANGKTLPTLTAEANALAQWLKNTHPTAPQVKPKSIRNKLGPEYWRQHGAQKEVPGNTGGVPEIIDSV